MLPKKSLALSLLLVSGISFSTAAFAEQSIQGFYAGLDGGYNVMVIDHDFFSFYVNNQNQFSSNAQVSNQGFSGGAFIGYEFPTNAHAASGIAIELDAHAATTHGSLDSVDSGGHTLHMTSKTPATLSFLIKPIYNLSDDNRLYGILGLTYTKFENSVEYVDNAGTTLVSEQTHNQWLPGLTAGLGLQTAINYNVAFRAELDYTLYKNLNWDIPSTLINVRSSLKEKPTIAELRFGFLFS